MKKNTHVSMILRVLIFFPGGLFVVVSLPSSRRFLEGNYAGKLAFFSPLIYVPGGVFFLRGHFWE